uniref:Uncharacterized protein n=1 Tax=Oryza punctata TaxID=4537 RepID=A0A0E0JH86_ORYPU
MKMEGSGSSSGSSLHLSQQASSIQSLRCACRKRAAVLTSYTPRNPRRRWLQCYRDEDVLNRYVEEMVAFSEKGELEAMRHHFAEKEQENSRLQGLVDGSKCQLETLKKRIDEARELGFGDSQATGRRQPYPMS